MNARPSFFFSFALLALFLPRVAFADTDRITPDAYLAPAIPTTAAWVAPFGSDITGDGSITRPFFTPARAAEQSLTVVLLPGRYPQFGTLTRGGTDREPLIIRATSSSEPVILALQDAHQPININVSHLRLEGLTISGTELVTPGNCTQFSQDVTDVIFSHVNIDHCSTAIATNGHTWTNGTIEHSTIRDSAVAIDCRGTCTHQRWTRLRLEHLSPESVSSSAIFVSSSSSDLRLRDILLRDVVGDGATFAGGRPSLVNTLFTQISGTALTLNNGGFIGRTEIAASGRGLVAHIGPDLVIERSLFHRLTPEAIPFSIAADDKSSANADLIIAWSRLEATSGTLALASKGTQAHLTLNSNIFWFSDPQQKIILPNTVRIPAEGLLDEASINHESESEIQFNPPDESDLFSPLFSGGETIHNENGTRTITSGSQIRGNRNELPYVLGESNAVHLLPTAETQQRWYPYSVEVAEIGNTPFGELARGQDVTEPPGTLIKAKTRPEVYLVVAPNFLRWIKNEATAAAYAGPRWNQQITELPNIELTKYQEIEPIDDPSAFEEADVLRQITDPADLFDERF